MRFDELKNYIWRLAIIMCLLSSVAKIMAKSPERLFEPLADTPDITLIYISEAALRGGVVPSRSAINMSLRGSTLTSFEMAKAQFDGKEKREIDNLAKLLIKNNKYTLLSEVREGFDGGFTRIYYTPSETDTSVATKVFVYKSSKSFGATIIYMTGEINLKNLFNGNNFGNLGNMPLSEYLRIFQMQLD